jgi:hypothetical protein
MNFRRFGNASITVTLMLLAGNIYLNRDLNQQKLGEGPEGFPWPTDGLGQVTIGMEGRFRIDLEERVSGDEGSTERIPTMSVVGKDPRPEAGGMAFQSAVVKGFSTESDSSRPQVIARASQAWLPVQQVKGATTLDRTRPWKMIRPTVNFPGLAGGQDFQLTTTEALLNARSNGVSCPGEFRLSSPGLVLSGTGIRMDPSTGELHFGEVNGNLDWKITLDSGEALMGHTDGGGTFGPISEDQHALVLRSVDSCYMTLPESTAIPSRLETDGFEIYLQSNADSWRPQRLAGMGGTYWAGESGALSGGPVDGRWIADGKLGGLLVDGPILGHRFGQSGAGWLTASGGAYIQAKTEQIDLWEQVTLQQKNGQVHSEWAELGPGRKLKAGGEVLLLSQHGMAFADSLESIKNSADMKCADVLAYLVGEKLDTVRAPHLIFQEDGNIISEDRFSISGYRNARPWKLAGNSLRASNRNIPILAQANGSVKWDFPDGHIFASQVQVRENGQISAKGNPLLATLTSPNGAVIGIAQSCFMSGQQLSLSGNPRADFPASMLGLQGSRCLVSAENVNREMDGTWVFRGSVIFTGALTGSALTARIFPDGTLELTRHQEDIPMEATTVDGYKVRAKADWIRAHSGGKIELKFGIDAQATTPTGEVHRITGKLAEASRLEGWVAGEAKLWSGDLHCLGQRLWWASDEFEVARVFLQGGARFYHPQSEGRAHRLEISPEKKVLELHRNARHPTWMRLEDGRVITADWIRLDTVHMLFSSRNGIVNKSTSAK